MNKKTKALLNAFKTLLFQITSEMDGFGVMTYDEALNETLEDLGTLEETEQVLYLKGQINYLLDEFYKTEEF